MNVVSDLWDVCPPMNCYIKYINFLEPVVSDGEVVSCVHMYKGHSQKKISTVQIYICKSLIHTVIECFRNGLIIQASVCRSSLLDWKKDRNRTEPNCKRPDHRLRLHKFWIFSVASCNICRKFKKPKKTGLDRLQPVFRPVMCWTLLTHIFP